MTNFSRHTELIDDYLSGGLSASEESSFMELMETDPILKEELLFQQSIVGGLKEYRKDELKQRLNGISVGVGLMGFLMNFATYKLVAAVLTLGIVGYGAFQIIDNDFGKPGSYIDNYKESLSEADYPSVENANLKTTIEWIEISNRVDDHFKELENTKNQIVDNVYISKSEIDKQEDDKTPKLAENSDKNSSDLMVSKSKVTVPAFSLPQFDDVLEEETLAGIELDDYNINNSDFTSDEAGDEIEIKKIQKNNRSLQYKFRQGKLYLFGDFKGKTYELLEINSASDRKLYFYFNKQYFKLDQFQKSVKDLSLITDRRLVKELEIIRNNR